MKEVQKVTNINDAIVFRDDDIHAIQDKVTAFENMYADQNFVLRGCEISGTASNATVSEGVVMLYGKLYTVAQQTGLDLTVPRTIMPLSENLSDPRALSSGGSQDRMKTRLAHVTNITIGGEGIPLSFTSPPKTFEDVYATKANITNALIPEYPSFLTLTSDFETFAGYGVIFRKNPLGEVWMSGAVKKITGSSVNIIGTLPAGYRPNREKHFLVWNQTTAIHSVVRINATTGAVELATTVANNDIFWLDAVKFYVDM